MINPQVAAKTLFATHYHELTDLALTRERVRNFNVAVKEWQEQIIFLRRIVKGGASHSYGIQVARLAGLPAAVIERAREVLHNLEAGEFETGAPRLAKSKAGARTSRPQLGLFDRTDDLLRQRLDGDRRQRADAAGSPQPARRAEETTLIMKNIFLIWLMICLLAPLVARVSAADLDTAYRQARDAYAALQASPRKQKFRSEWDRVLRGFVQVYEREPGGAHAGEALFMAARPCTAATGSARSPTMPGWQWPVRAGGPRCSGQFPGGRRPAAGRRSARKAARGSRGSLPALSSNRRAVSARRYDAARRATTDVPRPLRSAAGPPGRTGGGHPGHGWERPSGDTTGTGDARLSGVRFWSNPGYTRVVLDLTADARYMTNFLKADPVENLPPRLYLDIGPATLDPSLASRQPIVDDGLLRRIRTGTAADGKVRVVLDLVSIGQYKIFPLNDPFRVVIDISAEPDSRS